MLLIAEYIPSTMIAADITICHHDTMNTTKTDIIDGTDAPQTR